jgi:ribosomal protein S6--L-glutamate ligase
MKKNMKIALLASNPDLYSHKRIIEAAEARGHTVDFIAIKDCYMDITASKPEIHYRGGEILGQYDAVIPRIRPAATFYGTTVLRQFASQGAYCLNGPVAISRSRDKLRTLQILSGHGVNIPKTGFADSPRDTKDLIKMIGGAPLIIKLLEGTQGIGVVLAETNKAAESVINAFKSLKAQILVQEFIKEAKGVDLRLFVVGEKVVASMERRAAPGEFRANIHMGGTGHKAKITPEERRMAIKAAKAMELRVAGVDIIRSERGPMILEINSSPGLEGVEGATKVDIASLMIEHIEKNAKGKKVLKT